MEVEPRPSVFRTQDELSAGVVADVDGGGDGLVEDVVRFVDLEAHGYLGACVWHGGGHRHDGEQCAEP